MADFNNLAADLGQKTLPALNIVLRNFKSILEGIRAHLPGGGGAGGATVGARVIEGAGAGAAWGVLGGPGGVAGGTIIGGVGGGVEGILEQYMKNHGGVGIDKGGSFTSPGKTGKPAVAVQPIPNTNITLNLDSETLAQSVIKWITKNSMFQLGAPASDGSKVYGP